MARAPRDKKPREAKAKPGRLKHWATAVDLGSYSVKIVTVGSDDAGHTSVKRVTIEPLSPAPENSAPEFSLASRRTEALKKALSRHGRLRGRIVLGLPRSVASVRYLTLPSADPDEIRTMLFYDIERHVPFPVETLEIDFEILKHTGEHESLIMMVSALREEILAQMDICVEAGLHPDAVDIDILGACAVYIPMLPPDATELVLDIGRESTNLGVISEGQVLFSRSLPVSESRLLESFRGAQRWRDLATRFTTIASLPPKERGALESWVNHLILEVMRSVSSFCCESYGKPAQRIILCGGAGYIPSAPPNTLGVRLRTKVVTLPPLNGGLPESKEYHGSELATAIGLGVRALQPKTEHINLIPKEVVKERKHKEKKGFFVNVGILIILGLLMLGGTGFFKYYKVASKLAELEVTAKELRPLKDEIKKMEEKIEIVEAYLDNEHSALTVLYNVLKVLPDQYPKNVSISNIDFEKRRSLRITGQVMTSEQVDAISELLREFQNKTDEHPALFDIVNEKSRSSRNLGFDDLTAWDFEFNCDLTSKERPDEKLKRGSVRFTR